MASEIRNGYCHDCGKPVPIFRKEHTPNHLLHFLLTILTSGLWLAFWIGVIITYSFLKPGWQCAECGSFRVDLS